MKKARLCQLDSCDRPHFCKGYCRKHFEAWRRHGDPLVNLKPLSSRGAPLAWLKANAAHQDNYSCLIWPFARFPDGRAHMASGKPTRIMCELAHGPAPSAIHEAAHSCGQGHNACVNPRHLRWATPAENAADKIEHGTIVVGEKHYAAKLSEDQVRRIRSLAGSLPQKDIAARFGVGLPAVNSIIHRKAWKHIS